MTGFIRLAVLAIAALAATTMTVGTAMAQLPTLQPASQPPDPTVSPIQKVTHDDEKGWKIVDFNAVTSFVAGSEGCDTPPPLGTGSLSLTVLPPDGHAGLDSVRYNRTYLRDLVALDYWECTVENNGQQAPFINLYLDWDNDNVEDDVIVFEPAYQNAIDGGVCGAASNQPRPTNGQWEHYDALRGPDGASGQACWWSYNDPTFRPGNIIRSLSQYVAQHPDAAIINFERPGGQPNPLGGVEIAMGDAGGPAQAYADALRIGDKNPNSTVTYDFDPTHRK